MSYIVKTTYPKSEETKDESVTTVSRNEFKADCELPEVIEQYNALQRQGFAVTASFETDEAEPESPFAVGEALVEKGIDYTATLKVKNQGTYADAKQLASLIGAHGYDFTVGVTLKIDESSTVDFDHVDSWDTADEKEAKYKVNPKAKATNVKDLQGLFESLEEKGYEPNIVIKPKKTPDDDFDAQLASYPDGTLVKFSCSEAEL